MDPGSGPRSQGLWPKRMRKVSNKADRITAERVPAHWADKGCEIAHSCFNCPLVQCKYDNPLGYRSYLKEQRYAKIAAAFASGESVSQITDRFAISPRTAHRAIKSGRQAL